METYKCMYMRQQETKTMRNEKEEKTKIKATPGKQATNEERERKKKNQEQQRNNKSTAAILKILQIKQ